MLSIPGREHNNTGTLAERQPEQHRLCRDRSVVQKPEAGAAHSSGDLEEEPCSPLPEGTREEKCLGDLN